jgi:Flp pilus assembly protein TadD
LIPDSWAAFYYHGKALLGLGQAAKAVRLLWRASELNYDEASVSYQLGRALQALGRTGEAKIAMARVRELREKNLQKERDYIDTRQVVGAR